MVGAVADPTLVVGRYSLHTEIASGGMAAVYVGRLLGPVGFSRTVAIKRLHPHLARDPEFVAMFLDEARVVTRIRHPNVVPTLDVVATEGELFLVMEYVEGESLARLSRAVQARGERMPPRIAASVISGALLGLHAAHEARDERGLPLEIVHRDVSPQNILVGVDGVPRVLDFGVAKALNRIHTTREGKVKGKLGYMAPEQLSGAVVMRGADVYASAVALWEMLTGKVLFEGDNEAIVLARVLQHKVALPSSLFPDVSRELDDVVMRGLAKEPADRFATARDMALALEKAVGPVSVFEIAAWVTDVASQSLGRRAAQVAAVEAAAVLPSERDLDLHVAGLTPTASQPAWPAAAREPTTDPFASTKVMLPVQGNGETPPETRRIVPAPPAAAQATTPEGDPLSLMASVALPKVATIPVPAKRSAVVFGAVAIVVLGVVAGAAKLASRASTPDALSLATSVPQGTPPPVTVPIPVAVAPEAVPSSVAVAPPSASPVSSDAGAAIASDASAAGVVPKPSTKGPRSSPSAAPSSASSGTPFDRIGGRQ